MERGGGKITQLLCGWVGVAKPNPCVVTFSTLSLTER